MSKTPAARLWTPANVITVIRILGVPFFVVVMLAPWESLFTHSDAALMAKPWVTAAVFLILSFSDFLDGYLARSRNEVTNFGKFMDPLADKLLVIAAFLAMTETGLLPAWVSLIVLFREFLVSGLRMMAASKGLVIAASWYGKAKTVSQMIAITLLILVDALPSLLGQQFAQPVFYLAWFVLIVSLVLTILSMADYFWKSRDVFVDDPVKQEFALAAETVDLPAVSKEDLSRIAEETLTMARSKGTTLGTAESLTGGMIASSLTGIAGSSDTVIGGVVSYAYSAKADVLGVDKNALESQGAVNDWTAQQMAHGAKEKLGCTLAVAVTGIAGPGGAEEGKPVGTVWTSVAGPNGCVQRRFAFSGDRESVRMKTTAAALLLLQENITEL